MSSLTERTACKKVSSRRILFFSAYKSIVRTTKNTVFIGMICLHILAVIAASLNLGLASPWFPLSVRSIVRRRRLSY
jgi:hypothetical protein